MSFPKQKPKEGDYPSDLACTLEGLEDFKIITIWRLPGGSGVKNPPTSAGDVGSVPDPGRPHMLSSDEACMPRLLSLRSGVRGPRALKPGCPPAPGVTTGGPWHWGPTVPGCREPHGRQPEQSPRTRRPRTAQTAACSLKGNRTSPRSCRNLRTWAVEGSRMLFPSTKYS